MNIAVCDDEENIRYLIKRLIEKLIDKQAVPCQYVFQGGKLFFPQRIPWQINTKVILPFPARGKSSRWW